MEPIKDDKPTVTQVNPTPRWRPYPPQRFSTFRRALLGTSGITSIAHYKG